MRLLERLRVRLAGFWQLPDIVLMLLALALTVALFLALARLLDSSP